jgi:hypothetical protein
VQGLDGLDGTNKDSSVAEQDIINQF